MRLSNQEEPLMGLQQTIVVIIALFILMSPITILCYNYLVNVVKFKSKPTLTKVVLVDNFFPHLLQKMTLSILDIIQYTKHKDVFQNMYYTRFFFILCNEKNC